MTVTPDLVVEKCDAKKPIVHEGPNRNEMRKDNYLTKREARSLKLKKQRHFSGAEIVHNTRRVRAILAQQRRKKFKQED